MYDEQSIKEEYMKSKVSKPFSLLCLDNTPGACSSSDLALLNDVEDCQVHPIGNGWGSSSVQSEKFDAECSQADDYCTESNKKNSKVENRKNLKDGVLPHKPITEYRERTEEMMKNIKSKEFEDIQSGNNKEENYESFVLPSSDAEFVKCQGEEGLEEPRSDVRSGERGEENSEETIEKYGGIGDFVGAHGEKVLYNPIRTAPLN